MGKNQRTLHKRSLYSKGRKDASYHFFDAQFFPLVHFENVTVNLIDENLADDLFELIGTIIRPAGQLYLSYLNDEQFFRIIRPSGAGYRRLQLLWDDSL